jgi:hypothetical protein
MGREERKKEFRAHHELFVLTTAKAVVTDVPHQREKKHAEISFGTCTHFLNAALFRC